MDGKPRTDGEEPGDSQLTPEEAKKAIQLLGVRAGGAPDVSSRTLDVGRYLTWITQEADAVDKEEVENIGDKITRNIQELDGDTSIHAVNLALWITLASAERALRKTSTKTPEDPMFR